MTRRAERHVFEGTSVWSVAKEFLTRARRTPGDSVKLFLGETIWHWDLSVMSPVNRRIVLSLRMLYLVGRRFVSARAQRQAMALTYTTMLALVPAFAITVAVFSFRGLGGMKMHVQNFAIEVVAASPEQEQLLAQWLNDLVYNMQGTGGVAGAAFLVFLFITIVSLLSTLEKTLNDVWAVQRQRSFISKFVTYWCIATLGPLFLGLALVQGANLERQYEGLRAWGTDIGSRWLADKEDADAEDAEASEDGGRSYPGVAGEFAGEFEAAQRENEAADPPDRTDALDSITWGTQDAHLDYLAGVVSLLLTVITFTFIYAFLPNTRVRLKPALQGAVVAAVLWTATKWGLALSSAGLVRYNTVYGSLATIPITMFWLYLTWLIVILGAEVTFALQNIKSQRREELSSETTEVFKELVALRLVAQIARLYEKGDTPPDHEALEDLTGAPLSLCQSLLFHLTEDGLLREIDLGKSVTGYVPARPLEKITISDVIDSLRERRGIDFELTQGRDLRIIQRHLTRAGNASKVLAGQVTLRRLVEALEADDGVLGEQPAPVSEATATAILRATSTDLRAKVAEVRADSDDAAEPSAAQPESAPVPTAPEGED